MMIFAVTSMANLVGTFSVNSLNLADVSGLIMLSSSIAMMVMSPVGGSMTDKHGTRLPSGIGLIFICASCLLMSSLKESSSYSIVIFTLVIMGIGTGLSVSSINTAILNFGF